MITVGFIGLGVMGTPMAANLAKAGFDVHGYRRRWEDGAKPEGVGQASSVREIAASADVVITMLPDTADVESVLRGPEGVFAVAKTGTLVIDMSTIDPIVTEQLHEEAHTRGLRMLDAPVSGGETGAQRGTLSIMIGGDALDAEAASTIFDALGKTIVRVGGPGRGQIVKAANQIVVAGNLQLLAEAVTFLDAYGVDLKLALSVIGGGLAGSAALDQKATNLIERRFEPGFRVRLHSKDLGIATSAATARNLTLPATALVTQLMLSLVGTGRGEEDHSALLAQCLELNGRS